MKLFKKFLAELVGTAGLVGFGCGVAVLLGLYDAGSQNLVVNNLVIALTFGLSIVAMGYSIGNVSGCHVNPAVSFGVLIYNYLKPKDKRNFSFVEFLVYVVAQIIGAFLGCFLLWLLFGKCSYGANQTSDFLKSLGEDQSILSAFTIETLLSAVFVLVVLGVTSQEKSERRAGFVIGLTLTLVHIFGIPFTGTSVNPARSLAPAVFAYYFNKTSVPLNELWIYLTAPLLGALVAAFVYWIITYTKNNKVENKPVVLEAKEEETLEEEKKEEVKEEPAEVKEEPKEEKVEEQPVSKEEVPVEEEKEKLDIKRVSFLTKLIKADKDLQVKYETIKNELLSYGVKSRMSFEGDTYRLHKIEYAFVTIRGKTLKLYLKLDPKKYENSPIPVKDESSKKKYETTPAVLKVKSDLSLKRALSLIDDTMNEAKITKKVQA